MVRSDSRPRRRLDPDERRGAILHAAARAFASQAYGDVTIASIATDAGASTALVYRYFEGKEDLYVELVRLAIADLRATQAAALAALPEGVSVRDRLRATAIVYLDRIASHPDAWALPLRQPGGEPAAAADLRTQARSAYVRGLETLLAPSTQTRHEYALWGYFGFLDAACLHWVERGCPETDRWPLIDAALGALEGALGDWAA